VDNIFPFQQAADNMAIRRRKNLSKIEDFKTALQTILQG
jgi:hypothetical protein